MTCSGERWNLVTDGQFPLRHYLHLEASRKKTKLSQHFYSFYDLRKEVRKALKHDSDYKSLEEVASRILILHLTQCVFVITLFVIMIFFHEPKRGGGGAGGNKVKSSKLSIPLFMPRTRQPLPQQLFKGVVVV